ncbi:hypothetical protein [Dactylosporangium sucinum]|nr:hypothetical protein [Dactylosporangium sucinum]
MRAQRLAGWTWPQIAEDLNQREVPTSQGARRWTAAVARALVQHWQQADEGVRLPSDLGDPPDLGRPVWRQPTLSDADRATIRQLYIDGTALEEIKATFGVSKNLIYSLVGSSERRRPAQRPNKPDPRALAPLELGRLRQLSALAAKVRGQTSPDHPAREHSRQFAELLAALIDEGFTARSLADKIGCSRAKIELALGRHGHRPLPPSLTPRSKS